MTVKIHSCEHILNERKKGKCFHKHEYSLNDGKMCFSSNGKWLLNMISKLLMDLYSEN